MKGKIKKRLRLALFAVMLLVSTVMMAIGTAAIFSTFTVGDITYSKVSDSYYEEDVEVAVYRGDSKLVRIPATASGYNVLKIRSYAFENKDMEAVIIPASVEEIGTSAFKGCDSLKYVYYCGSSGDIWVWASGNEAIKNATWIYNFNPNCSHSYDNQCDTECNMCSLVRTTEHKYTNSCDAECDYCGATREIIHNFAAATCTKPETCKVCGAVNGTKLNHKYDNACDADCNLCSGVRATKHDYSVATCTKAKTCKVCKATSGKALGHKYTNKCDTTCNTCGSKRTIKHTYSNACDKSCNVCGNKRTVPAHKYTNKCDKTCNVCNYKRTITHTYSNKCDKKCNVCGYTRNVSHKYKTITTKATQKKNGSIVKKCTVCQNVASKTVIKAAKTIKISADKFNYDGKVKNPTVTVKNSAGKTLKKGTDYKVTYSAALKGVGTYKVTVKMIGKYSGTKTFNVTVLPAVKTSLNVVKGGTASIGAKSNKTVTYTSSNKSVATVNNKGVVTAKKAGTVTVTVKSGTVSTKVTVKVTNPGITITSPANNVYRGNTLKLTAKTTPAGAKVTWSTSNKAVATVSAKGVVKGIKYGSATITAKMTYNGKTYTANYKINVKVLEPDFSIFISQKSDYTDLYAVSFFNNGTKPVTILNYGYVYCGGEGAYVIDLFGGDPINYCDKINVAPYSVEIFLYCLEEDILFLSNDTVWVEVYFEYDGEVYAAFCRTSIDGLNKCYNVIHSK